MTGTPLTEDAIKALLEPKPTRGTKTAQAESNLPRPIQVGYLRWFDITAKCASRGCGTSTLIRVKGIPYCTTHALNILNEECMKLDGTFEKSNLDSCTCNAGKHSKNNIHTSDCPVYELLKGIDDRDSSSVTA